MIRFINKTTGTVMWVHETRVDEYLAAGHKLAPPPDPPKPAPRRSRASSKPKEQTMAGGPNWTTCPERRPKWQLTQL